MDMATFTGSCEGSNPRFNVGLKPRALRFDKALMLETIADNWLCSRF